MDDAMGGKGELGWGCADEVLKKAPGMPPSPRGEAVALSTEPEPAMDEPNRAVPALGLL